MIYKDSWTDVSSEINKVVSTSMLQKLNDFKVFSKLCQNVWLHSSLTYVLICKNYENSGTTKKVNYFL